MIELGLSDGVSKPLTALDKQINGVESGLIGMQSEFDALERSTTDFGRTAGGSLADVEDDIAGVDDAVVGLEDQIEDTAAVTVRSAKDMSESFAKVGAAIGAAAVATEAYLRSQQDLYFAADKIAYITDMDRREVIGLAADLNNLSFSLEDAYGVMEVGARQGLRTQSELEQYARFWDAIGTAAGEDATDLARRAVALQSVNIQAADLAETTDTLGFVMTHTNVGIGQYLNLVGDMAKKMDAYDLSIEDTAVMLAALEERGLAAEKSTELLQSAMTKAKGDTGALYRELGITEDQVARLNEEIKGGSDYIDAMGEAYNDAQTPLQWVQMEAGKIGHALGADLNPLLEVGSVAMASMSSALLMGASAAYFYSVASTTTLLPSLGAATASAWAFTTALMANPITWIVLGIVGLGAALYLLASNWDSVSGWFMDRWDEVGAVATGAIDWIGNAWDSTVGAIVAGVDWLGDKLQFFGLLFPFTAPIAGMHLLRDNWDIVTGAIAGGWDWLASAAQDGAAWLGETIGGALSGISDLFWQYHPIGILIRQWDEITSYLQGIDLVETGKNILLGLVNGILGIRQQAIDAVMGIGEGILNALTGFFGIRSPSRLMQEMGHHVGEGFALGVGESMPDRIRLPDAIEGSIRPGPVGGGCATAWTEPTAPSLAEPAVGDLAGEVAYSSTLTEPAVEDLAGRAVYSSVLAEPAVGDLAGRAVYSSVLTEPAVGDLAGTVAYDTQVSEPSIPALEGTVEYRPDLVEPDYLTGAGEVRYTPVFDEPAIRDLEGVMKYHSDLTGPAVYTPERDAPYMAGERSGDVNYTTTINVTAGSGDAQEIANVVDRRIRQTFDRNADRYFARQRRLMG